VEPPNTNTHISVMCLSDVPDVVAIHLSAFHGFFLSDLGRSFLSIFYASVVEDSSGVALVARVAEQIQGFMVGTTQPSGFYRRIFSRKGYRFAFAAMIPALRNPRIILRLLRSFQRTTEYRIPGAALALSLGVAPAAQGKAIGYSLVSAFLNECRQIGAQCVYLTTDQLNNDRANRLYLKIGFELSRTYVTPEGRLMNEYRHTFAEADTHTIQNVVQK
jgi:GNAT superfamily N-acetyltransferase